MGTRYIFIYHISDVRKSKKEYLVERQDDIGKSLSGKVFVFQGF